ncbi:GH-E family nuclease [Sorangium sp. So ce1024]|uniref:GH-E family nuclease n=1 Tax=Sorangium sp. So ce1024 TaxID=3133327 RepID=UPI003F51E3C5
MLGRWAVQPQQAAPLPAQPTVAPPLPPQAAQAPQVAPAAQPATAPQAGKPAQAGKAPVKPTASSTGAVTKRPSGFRKQAVQDAWDDAVQGSKAGSKACPDCGKDVDVAPGQGRRDWDVDHQPKWKNRGLTGRTRKEVLDEYNKDVRLRCPTCNRSDNR